MFFVLLNSDRLFKYSYNKDGGSSCSNEQYNAVTCQNKHCEIDYE